LVALGFEQLGLHRITICAGVENKKSRAVIERLGFTQEGVMREAVPVGGRFYDAVLYSILEAEWRERAGR
jgi:ribosomal-protein-serine acetyltransferase